MKKGHYITGIIISVFAGLHLLNHLLSVRGIEEHIQFMNVLRGFYRNILVEIILLGAILFQIVSGIKFFRDKRKTAVVFFDKVQIWSGLYLAIFFIFHISAVMGGRYLLHLDTNFYFGAAGLNTFPFYLFFVPYYGLAVLSFFGHISAVHSNKMKRSILGLSPDKQARLILLSGALVALVIFYGFTNPFKEVSLPETYNILIGK